MTLRIGQVTGTEGGRARSKLWRTRFGRRYHPATRHSTQSMRVVALRTTRGGTAPLILNVSSRWRWKFRLMPQTVYFRRRSPSPQYLGGLQRLSGRVGKKRRNFLALPGFEPRLLGCSARNNSHYADYSISFPASAKEHVDTKCFPTTVLQDLR
jgi:hypothetical protein